MARSIMRELVEMNKESPITHYTLVEGGEWIKADRSGPRKFHSCRFENGFEWDRINGLRHKDEIHEGCGGTIDVGFGLAGGGYGVYEYCKKCGNILSKTQEIEEWE